jgi:hypothetical protein
MICAGGSARHPGCRQDEQARQIISRRMVLGTSIRLSNLVRITRSSLNYPVSRILRRWSKR